MRSLDSVWLDVKLHFGELAFLFVKVGSTKHSHYDREWESNSEIEEQISKGKVVTLLSYLEVSRNFQTKQEEVLRYFSANLDSEEFELLD